MPIRLTEDERRRFFDAAEEPAVQLDLLAAAGFRAAAAALRLGVFEALAEHALEGDALAARLGTDPAVTGFLLETLESFGYVERAAGGGWAPSAGARRWLRPPTGDGPDGDAGDGFDFTAVVDFWALQLFELWGDLEDTVRRGRPGFDLYRWLDQRPAAQRVFQRMLGQLAELNAGEVLAHLGVPAGRPLRLLDVGGGHGRHALAFCRRLPGASATIVDLASSLEVARENAAAAGLTERVELRAADFLQDDLGGGYDVVFLFSIVHSFDPATNRRLLERLRAALAPGGRLAVLEQLAGAERPDLPAVAEAFHRVFRLNLCHLLGGRTYALDEVRGWLLDGGFTVERTAALASTGDHLLVARRGEAERGEAGR